MFPLRSAGGSRLLLLETPALAVASPAEHQTTYPGSIDSPSSPAVYDLENRTNNRNWK